MAKNAYIVISHKFSPNPEATSQDDAWKVEETCEFVDQLKNRMYQEATAIIDYNKKELAKNRVDHVTFEMYIEYVGKTYSEKYKQFLEAIGNTI